MNLSIIKRKIPAIVFTMFALQGVAQNESPPSLSMGLDHLVFGKGIIDVELLSEIIASKQEELKREFIKRTIVDNVIHNNFTYFNYATNTLDIILKEKNKKIITREVMEYTANFALVYGITELYIELELKSLGDRKEKGPLSLVLADFGVMDENIAISNDKIFKLERLRSYNDPHISEPYQLSNVLIDMVFDICKNNYHILNKGFFLQALNETDQEYKNKSAYLKYREAKRHNKNKEDEEPNIDKLKKDIESKIIPFFEFYEVLQETNFLKGIGFADFLSEYEKRINEKFQYQSPQRIIEDINKKINDFTSRKSNREATKAELNFRQTEFKNALTQFADSLSKIEPLNDALRKLSERQNNVNQIYGELDAANYLRDLHRLSKLPYLRAYDTEVMQEIIDKLSSITTTDLLSENTASSLRKLLEDIKPKVDSANIYYDLSNEIEYYDIELSHLGEEKKLLENNSVMFLKDQNWYIVNSSIKAIKKSLLKIRETATRDTTASLAKIYHTLTLLENPNRQSFNISTANYILDTLTTSLINNVFISSKTNDVFYDPFLANDQDDSLVAFMVDRLELIAYQIKFEQFKRFKKGLDGMNGFINNININPNNFIDFITQLNSLDKASTYDYLFKSIVDAGAIFADDTHVSIFNSLINNIKKYVITDDTNNALEFDVEGIIVMLYDIYGDRPSRPFSLYFGIGLNTTFQISRGIALDEDNISSMSLASEKIGLKLKLVDFKRNYAKDEKISNPIVSDWYLFAYGSGLLYNLVNIKSEKSFDAPILGIGTGLSFYNFLDFNISIGVPKLNGQEQSDWRYRFIAFGFDIKISEYLSELAKKRKNEKR